MKSLALLIGQTTFASLLIATTSASAQVAQRLEASDPHWSVPVAVYVRHGHATNYPGTCEVSALFRNVGEKAIKAVTWKYLFYRDEEQTQLLHSYTFHSSRRIDPGASVRLTEGISELAGPRHWSN